MSAQVFFIACVLLLLTQVFDIFTSMLYLKQSDNLAQITKHIFLRLAFGFFAFFFLLPTLYCQLPASKTDSFISLIKKDKEDTNKVMHLNALGRELDYSNPDTAIIIGNQSLALAEKLNWQKGIANSLGNLGVYYLAKSDYHRAQDYYLKALKIDELLGNKEGIARRLSNIGLIYKYQSDYPKALDYYFKALKMAEELGSKKGIAINLGNIGLVYDAQSDYPKALDYYFKALKMDEELGDKNGIAYDLCYIGNTHHTQSDSARKHGNTEAANRGYAMALNYHFRSLKLSEELGAKNLIAVNLGSIGELYTQTGKFKEAENFLKKAIVIDSAIGNLNQLWQLKYSISKLYDNTGRYQLALMFYKEAITLKDSVFTQEKNKDLTRREMNFEFEKKEAAATAEHEKQMAVAAAEKKKQQIIIWFVAIGLLLVALVLIVVVRSLQVTRRQKITIEQQKHLVEEHQKEIVDSITYAKRLQQAILPSDEELKKYFPESFLLYKPKDIVAGDFYWMEHLDGITFVAAADSTGHGVPGAMVSVVCSNALNRAVKEFGLRDTGKILDKTRELVLETFAKSSSDVKDGMDISLMRSQKSESQKSKEVMNEIQWSGANNPLWFIENGELKEIKADKQPIGMTENPTPFTTHTITCKPGSIFYLLTDGYADQFGGPKGKKYKYKQLEEKLLAISDKRPEEQKEILSTSFEDWKGNLEQIDDVTLIGIRL